MATLMQSRRAAQEPQDSESIVRALLPWQRRLSMQQLLRWTLRGIVTGLFLACTVLLISRLIPWTGAPVVAIGIAPACTIVASGMAIWKRLSLSRTARIVDSQLSLHDRLSTAWELREQTTTLARLQRRDALKQLQPCRPATTILLRPQRFTVLVFALVVLAFVLLLVLPNPMTSVLKQQAAYQARIAKQIAAIDKVRQDLTQQAGISPEEQQKIDQILRDLENKLQQAKSDTEAQQAISQAQSKLNQRRDPQAANKAQGNSAASSALQNSNNANLKALGNALANNDSKQVANQLQNLAIDKMSPAQRSQLAQQLENAANQAGQQNPALSSALHQLAKAVTDGNKSEIADASNAMQAATSQNASTQAKDSSINQTSESLQQAANNLASATDGSNNQNQQQSQGQQGQGQQAQGQGQQSQGQQGQGQQGQRQQGQGQGQGRGGSGGNEAGNKQGKNEQVTVPGQTSAGSSTQSADNNTGVVQQGASVPYSQVVEEYNQMAHDAIDNSNVSPNLKDLVHDYFNSLEGQ